MNRILTLRNCTLAGFMLLLLQTAICVVLIILNITTGMNLSWIPAAVIGLIGAAAAALIWEYRVRPSESLIQAGRSLHSNDLSRLTQAITDLGQGNFHVRIDSTPNRLPAGTDPRFEEFKSILNDLTAVIHNAAGEFNELTDVPCLRLCYVGSDSFLEGRLCGEAMASAVGGRGKISISTARLSTPNLLLRRKGFISLLKDKYPEIQIVDIHENKREEQTTREQTLRVLNEFRDLAGFYMTEAESPARVARVVEESGLAGKVKLVGHDLLQATMEYLDKGVITATISQDPYAQGHDPVIHLFNHIVAGWQPPTPRMLTRMEVVDRSNYHLHWNAQTRQALSGTDPTRLARPVDRRPDRPLRLVFVGREDSEFWIPLKMGALAAAEELKPYGVTVEWRLPKSESVKARTSHGSLEGTRESLMLEALIRERVDGIVTYLPEARLVKLVNKAVESGITVITTNGEPFNLRSLLYTVNHQALKLLDLSTHLSRSAFDVSESTSRIASSIERITSGIVSQDEQLQGTERELGAVADHIERIHWEADRSARSASDTWKQVETSSEALKESMESFKSIVSDAEEAWKTVQGLAETSERIDSVMQMIDEIASRVNVLALNAQIEATRAGEAGRGFMVVSNEIRSLSRNTTAATSEVSELVEQIKDGIAGVQEAVSQEMGKMRESSEVTDRAESTMGVILTSLGENRQRLLRIVEAVDQARKSSGQARENMERMSKLSATNTESLKEINAATEAMTRRFQDVAEMASLLEKIAEGEKGLLAKFTLSPGEN
ncbi:MAG: substrate-binding domain-containing protein [bacterium]|nr:substrate-binding domain-containing protein [bacterium]